MDSSIETEQDVYVAKFNVNNKPLYVNVSWKNDDCDLFNIKVFYGDNTWTGKYSNELAVQRRDRLDETEDTYNRNVKECLSGDSKDYVYDFTPDPHDTSVATFIWKKRYEGALKVYGAVPLRQDLNSVSKDTLLDFLLEKNKMLLAEVGQASKQNYSLKQDLEEYIHKLEELTQSKTALETTLYGRFVQVLNEKKKRIQLLEEHLNSL